MTDGAPANGHVVRYDYLWRREFDRGEESGRKSRPVCLSVILPSAPGATRILLFPITSRPPGPDRAALAIPEMELRRTGLAAPAWIVLDECNIDLWETSFNVGDRRPMGRFNYAFFARLRDAALEQLRTKKLRSVPRP